ncbi:MAG: SBBP repeat-containing protein [Bacteroidota bacterium]
MTKGFYHPFYSDWRMAVLLYSLPVLLFFPLEAKGQFAAKETATGVAWIKAISGSDYSAGADIAVDPQGNVIYAGVFREEITLDNDPDYRFSNRGKSDIVLLKTTPAGDVIWMQTIGGVGDDRAFRIAIDTAGHVYLTGSFERVIRFEDSNDQHTLESTGKEDAFLAKFDADGQILWSAKAGGERSDQGIGLTLSPDGKVYISGFFETSAVFGNQTITSKGQLDAYIAQYNAAGTFNWVRTLGGERRDLASGIAADSKGRVYVTGVTRGPLPLLDTDPARVYGAPHGQDDLFLARYTPTGTLDKLTYMGGRGFDAANALTVDTEDNVYIAGYFEDEAALDDFTGSSTLMQGQSFDLFVSKFDSDGALAWANTAGGDLWDNAYDIDVDPQGDVFITGLFRKAADFTGNTENDLEGLGEANAFIARYRSNGVLAGLQRIDGAKSEGAGIATDRGGNVFLTGIFVQDALFEGRAQSLSSATFASFIARYDATGFEAQPDERLLQAENQPAFLLSPNFPNPFASQTTFEIALDAPASVRLYVYDALGRVMDEISNSELAAGVYQFVYDASRLAQGTYFVRLETPTGQVTRTITRVR